MKSRWYLSAGVFLAFFLVTGGVYWWARPSNAPQINQDDVAKPAPDFTLLDLQGKSFKLSSARGKIVLLDFWATWCGPCVEDIPGLKSLQKKFGDKNLMVVGISVDDATAKEVAGFAREHKITYPVVLTGGQDKIPDGYDIFGLPTAYLIDGSGVIQKRYYGPKDEAIVTKDIQDILKHA